MDTEQILAGRAGIETIFGAFKAEVVNAIATADRMRAGFTRPSDPAVEPAGAGAVSAIPAEHAK